MAFGLPPPSQSTNLSPSPPAPHRPLTHNPKSSTSPSSDDTSKSTFSPITTVHAAPSPPSKSQERNQEMFFKPSPPAAPDPNAYAFPDLLTSLGTSASEPLDAMAEICGKSKMSLADQHGSHLAPVEERKVQKGEEAGLVQKVFEWLRGGKVAEQEGRRFTEEPASMGG